MAEESKPKTAAALKAEYDALAKKVIEAAKAGKALEAKLLTDVKAQVKKQAGDVEALQAKKREAHVAWEAAHRAEQLALSTAPARKA